MSVRDNKIILMSEYRNIPSRIHAFREVSLSRLGKRDYSFKQDSEAGFKNIIRTTKPPLYLDRT